MSIDRHPTRRAVLLALAAAGATACSSTPKAAAGADDAALLGAISGAHRPEANRARDAARRPYQTLKFFDIAPTATVLEVSPGNGWYTEILAPYLRERGQLIAAHYATDDPSESHRRYRATFDALLRERPAVFDRVKVVTLPDREGRLPLGPAPGSVDAVLTFRNVHNWLEAGTLDAHLRAFHDVLKPGGVFGVEEHRAAPGTTLAKTIASGYVTESLVIERAQAVGFRLDARSSVNDNPRDTKDHPQGVWSLPPTLRGGDADRAKFVAIGESDRMTLRFMKG